jgi:hypothetical protein
MALPFWSQNPIQIFTNYFPKIVWVQFLFSEGFVAKFCYQLLFRCVVLCAKVLYVMCYSLGPLKSKLQDNQREQNSYKDII